MVTVANLCPYWTWPPAGGGPLRVYNLNRVVAHQVQVLQFSTRPTFGHRKNGGLNLLQSHRYELATQYQEYQYSHPLITISSYFLYRLGLHSDLLLSDIVGRLSPKPLRQIVKQSSIIQVEHPWLFTLAADIAENRPIIFVAHNVEAALWQRPVQTGRVSLQKLANRSRRLEEEAAQRADAIIAMSQTDADVLVGDYGVKPNHVHIIPNGVDLTVRKPATTQEKAEARRRLGLDSRPVLLFIGSDHYPNKEALHHIQGIGQKLATELNVRFLIVGDVGRNTSDTAYMRVTGFVENVKDYLAAADIALNPLTSGSGTSLKTVEYLACGLPTITTITGIRGLNLVPGRDVLAGDVSEFPQLVAKVLSDQALQKRLTHDGRQAAERNYGWERLGQHMLEIYKTVCR
jgi:glycosyltransferase involved in cell wall biosynthesis